MRFVSLTLTHDFCDFQTTACVVDTELVFDGRVSLSSNDAGGFGGNRSSDDSLYRRRCLEWLRPRLPMAWVLNQAFLGRVPSSSAAAVAGAGFEDHGAAHAGPAKQGSLGRGFALAWVRTEEGCAGLEVEGNRCCVLKRGSICPLPSLFSLHSA